MPPAVVTSASGSSEPTSPSVASSAAVNETALKSTNAGVKKSAQKKKSKNNGSKHNQKAKLALQKMHAFCTSQSPSQWRDWSC